MAVAGKLINARSNTPDALAHISLLMLQDIGITSEEHRKRTVLAFKGKKAAGIIPRTSEATASTANGAARPIGLAPDYGTYRKRRRMPDDDESLGREYGNVSAPADKKASRRTAPVEMEYMFNEILEEEALVGRYAVVNRAPVMTAWAVILLERLSFNRTEALSLAHCYVSHTSTMRGISLGIIPASERDKAVNVVGPNQPHFELMGVKIPVMQMQDGSYRGISGGEVVGPEKAFNYMRRAMAQTLPSVVGALTLLADSFMEPTSVKMEPDLSTDIDYKVQDSIKSAATLSDDSNTAAATGSSSVQSAVPEYGAEYLNTRGYELYAEFRPSTSGEWGKKGRLWYDKILALRRGHDADMEEWRRKELQLEAGGPPEEEWTEDVERLVQEELEREQKAAQVATDEAAAESTNVKLQVKPEI
ncbi:hypothetical protein BCV70DRAFT_198467 [Testicularia cyperi]|uniref:Uncharacterized protein n=1 Tax=Testicularia cyperi TaxID=1882483 RepID=A0A317XWB1_9BASI|nr:hypothetical protein BCV70DRAFT_198467 [Testicularia cyperi]